MKHELTFNVEQVTSGVLSSWKCSLVVDNKHFGAYAATESEAVLKTALLYANSEALDHLGDNHYSSSAWMLVNKEYLDSYSKLAHKVKAQLQSAMDEIETIC